MTAILKKKNAASAAKAKALDPKHHRGRRKPAPDEVAAENLIDLPYMGSRGPPLLVTYSGLPALGIEYHKNHILKMVSRGEFPAPVKLGVGQCARVAFVTAEIIAWIEQRIAEARVTYKVVPPRKRGA